MTSAEHDFRLEEYRHISAAIIDLDSRIVRIFALAIAGAASILAVVAPAIFATVGPAKDVQMLGLAYWSIIPGLLVGAVLYFQLFLRRDMARLGTYRRVFFEDDATTGLQWETALQKFRTMRDPESREEQPHHITETNDPIPLIYWLFVAASIVLLIMGVSRAEASYWHIAWALLPIGVLAHSHEQWSSVFPTTADGYLKQWHLAKEALGTTPKP